MAQPSKVIVKNIGLATLNTFTLRLWYMYAANTIVKIAHKTDIISKDTLNGQL